MIKNMSEFHFWLNSADILVHCLAKHNSYWVCRGRDIHITLMTLKMIRVCMQRVNKNRHNYSRVVQFSNLTYTSRF